ncbi:MAG: COG4223 family protein [Alphaproteobacteria bacterium]
MSTDDASTAGNPSSQDRRRPAPTIELAATEVRDESERPGRNAGTWRLVGAAIGGGVVALLGFWAVNAALRPDTGTGALETRLAQAEQQLRQMAERPLSAQSETASVSALNARLAKAESALAAVQQPPPADPALANRIARTEGELKSSGEIVAILNRRTDETATLARDARQRADVNAAAIAELSQKIARLDIAPVGRSDLEAVSKRVAAIETNEKAMAAELAKRPALGATDPVVRFAVASAALREAVERGQPFAPLLATTKPFVKDPKQLAPLEVFAATGVPSVATLSRQLSELAPALNQAAGAPPRDDGLFERLTANAEKLVRVRRVQDVPGTDPTAVIMRIEVRAANSDLAGALAELAKLPDNVRAPAQEWIRRAEARTAAIRSSNQIAAEALAALGK